jgi:hypothetical protein
MPAAVAARQWPRKSKWGNPAERRYLQAMPTHHIDEVVAAIEALGGLATKEQVAAQMGAASFGAVALVFRAAAQGGCIQKGRVADGVTYWTVAAC